MGFKILFVSQEVAPYVVSAKSQASAEYASKILENKNDVRLIMPRYASINERRNQLHEVIRLSGTSVSVYGKDYALLIKVASLPKSKLQIFFTDNNNLFANRKTLSSEISNCNDFIEDGSIASHIVQCSLFFSKSVVAVIDRLKWYPDIVSCQGWFSFLTIFAFKMVFQAEYNASNLKFVVNLSNDSFDGVLDKGLLSKMMLPKTAETVEHLELLDNPSYIDLVRFSILHSTALIITEVLTNKDVLSLLNEYKKPIFDISLNKDYKALSNFYNTL